MMQYKIHNSDITEYLKAYAGQIERGESKPYHAVIGDTPYNLSDTHKRFSKANSAPPKDKDGAFSRLSKGFMGAKWDGFDSPLQYQEWVTEWASELIKCVYPGALVAFYGGSRTYHRVATGLENAGFIISDSLMVWTYADSFAKGANYSLMIDKRLGNEQKIVGQNKKRSKSQVFSGYDKFQDSPIRQAVSDKAKQFDDYHSMLMPAFEPVVIARAPYPSTLVDCAIEYGVSAFNIGETRVAMDEQIIINSDYFYKEGGRFTKNAIITHHPSCNDNDCHPLCHHRQIKAQSGQAITSDYYYSPKAMPWERNFGLDTLPDKPVEQKYGSIRKNRGAGYEDTNSAKNVHPTVKPIELSQYIAMLLRPPLEIGNKRLLIPFSGSGSEMIGAHLAQWDIVDGVELSPEYIEIAQKRLKKWTKYKTYQEAREAYERKRAIDKQRKEDKDNGQISFFDYL